MKTPSGRPRSRYRNEAVFHSAQRLLSARLTPPVNNHRPPLLQSRAPYLMAALAVALFVAGIFVGLHWRATSSAEIAGIARPPADHRPEEKAANTSALSSSEPSHGRLVASAAPTTRKGQRSRSGEDSDAERSSETSTRPPVQAFSSASASPLSAKPAATAAVVHTTVVAGPELTIRGQITSNSSPRLDLEFSLRRKDSALTGVVRYLLPGGRRVVANSVKGEITEERLVELRETGVAWTVSRTAPGILRELRPRRSFVFELPAQADAKEMFSGWWSSYIQHDASSGDLTLWFAAPW